MTDRPTFGRYTEIPQNDCRAAKGYEHMTSLFFHGRLRHENEYGKPRPMLTLSDEHGRT